MSMQEGETARTTDRMCDHPSMSAIEPTDARDRAAAAASAGDGRRRRAERHPVRSRAHAVLSAPVQHGGVARVDRADARTPSSATGSRCWRSKTARRGSSWATWVRSCSTSTASTRWSSGGRSRPPAPARGSRRRPRSRVATGSSRRSRVDHVISLILPDNVPSRGVAEHLGMTVWKEVLWGTEKPRCTSSIALDRPAA